MTAADSADEIVNPLVFQCKSCRTIVGDSFAWLSADEELNVVTLVSCNLAAVLVHPDMKFSTDGVDAGSAFHVSQDETHFLFIFQLRKLTAQSANKQLEESTRLLPGNGTT